MESVRRAAAMGRRIGQWIDDLQLLDDRARPSMRDDQGQRVVMFRANVNEVNVQPVDLGNELRQRVEPRLHLPPVVIGLPIAHELLQSRQRHALGVIVDSFLFGPPRRGQASAEIDEVLFGYIDMEGADRIIRGSRRRTDGKQTGGTCGKQTHGSADKELAPVLIDGLPVRLCRGNCDRRLQMRVHRSSPCPRPPRGRLHNAWG